MSIQELLEAARNTPVTTDEVAELRARLQKKANDKPYNSHSASEEFLARTYSL